MRFVAGVFAVAAVAISFSTFEGCSDGKDKEASKQNNADKKDEKKPEGAKILNNEGEKTKAGNLKGKDEKKVEKKVEETTKVTYCHQKQGNCDGDNVPCNDNDDCDKIVKEFFPSAKGLDTYCKKMKNSKHCQHLKQQGGKKAEGKDASPSSAHKVVQKDATAAVASSLGHVCHNEQPGCVGSPIKCATDAECKEIAVKYSVPDPKSQGMYCKTDNNNFTCAHLKATSTITTAAVVPASVVLAVEPAKIVTQASTVDAILCHTKSTPGCSAFADYECDVLDDCRELCGWERGHIKFAGKGCDGASSECKAGKCTNIHWYGLKKTTTVAVPNDGRVCFDPLTGVNSVVPNCASYPKLLCESDAECMATCGRDVVLGARGCQGFSPRCLAGRCERLHHITGVTTIIQEAAKPAVVQVVATAAEVPKAVPSVRKGFCSETVTKGCDKMKNATPVPCETKADCQFFGTTEFFTEAQLKRIKYHGFTCKPHSLETNVCQGFYYYDL